MRDMTRVQVNRGPRTRARSRWKWGPPGRERETAREEKEEKEKCAGRATLARDSPGVGSYSLRYTSAYMSVQARRTRFAKERVGKDGEGTCGGDLRSLDPLLIRKICGARGVVLFARGAHSFAPCDAFVRC